MHIHHIKRLRFINISNWLRALVQGELIHVLDKEDSDWFKGESLDKSMSLSRTRHTRLSLALAHTRIWHTSDTPNDNTRPSLV